MLLVGKETLKPSIVMDWEGLETTASQPNEMEQGEWFVMADKLKGVIEADDVPGTKFDDKHSPDYHLQRILERCVEEDDKHVDKAKPAGE